MQTNHPKNRILVFIAVSSLLCTFATAFAQTQETQETSTVVFNDVEEGDTNYLAIKFLKESSLINGYDDGTFKPLSEINRAEALKMIMQAIQGPSTVNTDVMNFSDVTANEWFYPSVLDAWNNYLVSGYPDGLFHPEKPINMAETLKIILKQEGGTIPAIAAYQPFRDAPIDAWYAPYAQIAKERTIVLDERFEGDLHPEKNVNRGLMADMIYRTLKSSNGIRFAKATWYADLLANQSTASGEPYIPNHFTVAHKTLPFGTKLLVTNMANGKSIEVTVNDRGPYVIGVDLDLSKSAFAAIASTGAGVINTQFQIITDSQNTTSSDIVYGF